MGRPAVFVVYGCVFMVVLAQASLAKSAERAAARNCLDEADLLGDIPIVTAGTRLKQKITATPTAISIIDRQMIAAEQHERLDLRVAYDFQLGNANGQIELLEHNIFDDFLEYQDSNIFERRWFIAVGFDFP